LNTNESYIPEHHKILARQARYLHKELDALKCYPADRQLFGHLVTCAMLQGHKTGKIPVPWETIHREILGANAFRLRPLVHISGFSPGRCRTYEPVDWIMSELMRISASMTPEEIVREGWVDFGTGRRMNRRPASRMNDVCRHPEPIITRACIEKLTLNRGAVMLDDFERKYQGLVRDFNALGKEAPRRERYRLVNNTSCREKLFAYSPQHRGEGVFDFEPAWYSVSTGRLHLVGGCLQSVSRDLKEAAYARMPGFRNFDAKSCQPSICVSLMEQAGIDASPLIDYLQTTDYKKVYGDAIGISGSIVKRIVISICMGAWLPKRAKAAHLRDNSILQYLIEEVGGDEDKLNQVLEGIWDALGGIASCLKKWHVYLLDKYIDRHKVRGGKGYLLPNEVGKRLPLWDLRLKSAHYRWMGVAKVAAHLLQGMEAAVIQEFIVRDEGMKVIQVDHDGFLINEGTPDMQLWAGITSAHGLGGLALEEKPL
jgi:hypothetical protein